MQIEVFTSLRQMPRSIIVGLHRKRMFNIFKKSQLFPRVTVPYLLPTSNVRMVQLLYIFVSICVVAIFNFNSSDKYVVTSHHGLTCISPAVSDAKHLFTCLFTTCISSLVKWLFTSLVHFLIGLSGVLLWSFESSLC